MKHKLVAIVALAAVSTSVVAQDYPARPVRIMVASVPGSAPDVLARLIAEPLGERLKQQVLVENRAGAGGLIGVDAVAKAPADGHTLVIGHDGTMAFSTVLHKKLRHLARNRRSTQPRCACNTRSARDA
jgi:tripartite-type tricarboxylate transporter receptor subunit TctC